MGKQSKGRCLYCQAEYTKAGMLRHTVACKERVKEMEKVAGVKQCGYFTLSITGKYDRDYWLIVEFRENAMLQDVDQFLRDIWLECCGHLSAFDIGGELYERFVDNSGFWDEPSKSMNHQLKSVLEKGMNISYEYDFGSTTGLLISVSDFRVGPWKKDKFTLLARNNPINYLCSNCGEKVAIAICPICLYDGTGFLCRDCEDNHECGEEVMLTICNSPRSGVCAYEGSDIYGD